MTENWKVQVSPKTPKGTLINVRGGSEDEFKAGLAWVRNNTQEILQVEELLAGATVVQEAVGAPVNVTPQQTPAQALAAPPVVAAGPPVPACKHGAMTFRQNKPGGKPWKAYFCNTPKGTPDQCEPEWIRD